MPTTSKHLTAYHGLDSGEARLGDGPLATDGPGATAGFGFALTASVAAPRVTAAATARADGALPMAVDAGVVNAGIGHGDATVIGGDGDDPLTGTEGADLLSGGLGNDTLNGLGGNDTLDGGFGFDVMDGGAGIDTADYRFYSFAIDANLATGVVGFPGAGTLTDSISNIENLLAGAGADLITGNGVDNSLSGGDGNDTLNGGAGNDALNGQAGNDTLNGGAGNDTVDGGAGNDSMNGGDNNDLYRVDSAGDVAAESLNDTLGGVDTVEASASHTLGFGIENLTLVGSAISGTGNDNANIVIGNNANNTLSGLGGNDTLDGGFGFDTLDGGAGIDTADYRFFSGAINANLTTGVVGFPGAGTLTDSIANIENLLAGGGADLITGNGLDNVLNGGAGNDTLDGGFGFDTLDGGAGIDTADYRFFSGAINANLTTGLVGFPGAGTLTDSIANIENLLAGAGADLLTGNGLDNSLSGGDGNDTLDGGFGFDTLDGGAGIDTADYRFFSGAINANLATGVVGFPGNTTTTESISNIENLLAGAGADLLTGNSLDNVLNGGAGNDTLDGGFGFDTLDGGDGIDTADYRFFSGAINANLATGVVGFPGAGTLTDSISNIENLLAGAGADLITGNGVDNSLSGGDGNDTLNGGAGNDALNGQAGNDTLNGSAGNDTVDGGAGNDSMNGGDNNDLYRVDSAGDVAAESLNDTLGGVDTVEASASHTLGFGIENLTLVGSAISGTGNDNANIVIGNNANNTLSGLGGNDTLDGGFGFDTLDGGAGIDTADYRFFSGAINANLTTGVVGFPGAGTLTDSIANIENLLAGGGADLITGNGLDNVLNGGAGNDTLDGGFGFDTLDGGAGIDTADYRFFSGAINANLTTGLVGFPGAGTLTDSIANIENLLAGAGADLLTGNGLDNSLSGGDGNDTLDGGFGFDTLDGGAGIDTADYRFFSGAINANLATGVVGFPGAGTLTESISNIENLLAGAGADLLTGNGLGNALNGGGGNDTLDGGAGIDTMTGGLGRDTYVVNVGGDLTIETSTLVNEIDTVISGVSRTLGANLEKLTLTGTARDGIGNKLVNTLTGNDARNNLNGRAGDDAISGGAGRDTLNGGTGDDSMLGGIGNDVYVVDSTNDITREASTVPDEIDLVQSSVDRTLGSYLENLTLTGAAHNGTGNKLANRLVGNDAANNLNGRGANDVLNGGLGNDTLIGGTEADTFSFSSALNSRTNVDRITDFATVDDRFLLDDAVFVGIGPVGRIAASHFHVGPGAADANDRVIYNKTTGQLFFDADGAGGSNKVLFATVTPGTAITFDDIWIG